MRILNKKHWPPALQVRLLDDEPQYTHWHEPTYLDERVEWCKQNLPSDSWYCFSSVAGWKTFAFKEISDLVVFTLKWK
jgi:hypothetical protein